MHNFCKNLKMSSTPKAVSIRLDRSNIHRTSAKEISLKEELSWAQKSYSVHYTVKFLKNQWSRTYVSLICFILLHFCYLYSIHWLTASKGSLSIRRFWGKQGRKKRKRERVTWKERNAFLSRPPPPPPPLPHLKISSSLTPKEGLILKLSKDSAFYWHRIILFRFSII